MSKREELREFFKRETHCSIAQQTAEMSNRDHAEAIRLNLSYLATQIAWHLAEEYRFMELADIMEWKRTRVRR